MRPRGTARREVTRDKEMNSRGEQASRATHGTGLAGGRSGPCAPFWPVCLACEAVAAGGWAGLAVGESEGWFAPGLTMAIAAEPGGITSASRTVAGQRAPVRGRESCVRSEEVRVSGCTSSSIRCIDGTRVCAMHSL